MTVHIFNFINCNVTYCNVNICVQFLSSNFIKHLYVCIFKFVNINEFKVQK